MYSSEIISVGDVLVRQEILDTPFSCDLSKCKGGCCTIESDYGAPLNEDEIGEIEKILPIVREYLPENHLSEIDKNGFYEIKEGEKLTTSFENKACVFVFWENGIAKCGIERAYFDGKVSFRKPVSCHLFPIRVSKFGGDVLRYEKFNECVPALEKGVKEKTNIVDCCKDALIRLYGKDWYSILNKENVK
jgi:hypothetical protein